MKKDNQTPLSEPARKIYNGEKNIMPPSGLATSTPNHGHIPMETR